MNFARNHEKTIILGISDAWWTIHLSHRPSNQATKRKAKLERPHFLKVQSGKITVFQVEGAGLYNGKILLR